MSTELLQLGLPRALVQNQVYALPTRSAQLAMTDTTQTIRMANLVDMTAPVILSFTNGQASVNGGFIDCTTGTPTILLKAE